MAQAPLGHIRRLLLAGVVTLALPCSAAVAWAQPLTQTEWHQGTSLALFGGLASPDQDARAALGGTISWEVTRRIAFDASGLWFPAGARNDIVLGTVGARVSLTPGHRATPYLTAGVGLLHASMQGTAAHMPGFYRDRMMMPVSSRDGRTFDDFAVRLGAGAEILAGRRISIRPELQVVIASDRPDATVIPVVGVHLAYHFESHPITPSRR